MCIDFCISLNLDNENRSVFLSTVATATCRIAALKLQHLPTANLHMQQANSRSPMSPIMHNGTIAAKQQLLTHIARLRINVNNLCPSNR